MRTPTEETLKKFEHYWQYGGSKLIDDPKKLACNAYINGRVHAFKEGYEKRYWYERELERKAKAEADKKHQIMQEERRENRENSNNYSC